MSARCFSDVRLHLVTAGELRNERERERSVNQNLSRDGGIMKRLTDDFELTGLGCNKSVRVT